MSELIGPTSVVTGAGSGIGLATAQNFASGGARGFGLDINMCSIVASVGLPQRAIYSASKGAVEALTRAMAADLIHEGIRVNCVNPGTADTSRVARLLDPASDPTAERTALEQRQPSGRRASAAEAARAIRYLADPDQRSTTGTVLAVDGGIDGSRVPSR